MSLELKEEMHSFYFLITKPNYNLCVCFIKSLKNYIFYSKFTLKFYVIL